ncbi:MAG: hypothetical protein ABIY52_05595 [Gemmatimonadaceae bacterium]
MTRLIRISSIAAIAFAAACSSDSSLGPSSTPVDLATAFSELQVPGISAAASAAGGLSIPSASSIPSGCGYVATSQNFVCPAVTSNGVTLTSSYSLLDAAGHSLTAFDAGTVASLRVKSSINGTVAVSGDALTIAGEQDQTLSGLQSSSHTLNGTSTLNMHGTSSTAINIQSTTTISNLVLPAHGATNQYPTSGTVAVDQVTSVSAGVSLASRVVMTFNGTSKVGVTLTVDGHTIPGCTIDLAKSTPSCG